MAALMLTGAKIGAIIGRKRAFAIGCVIYGCGSFTTSIAPSLPVLLFGWSFLEGVGAALIMPAIVALVAGNFATERRPAAYGLVAAAGAVAVAVGPLIGGFSTTLRRNARRLAESRFPPSPSLPYRPPIRLQIGMFSTLRWHRGRHRASVSDAHA
jgi:MFS family permease